MGLFNYQSWACYNVLRKQSSIYFPTYIPMMRRDYPQFIRSGFVTDNRSDPLFPNYQNATKTDAQTYCHDLKVKTSASMPDNSKINRSAVQISAFWNDNAISSKKIKRYSTVQVCLSVTVASTNKHSSATPLWRGGLIAALILQKWKCFVRSPFCFLTWQHFYAPEQKAVCWFIYYHLAWQSHGKRCSPAQNWH